MFEDQKVPEDEKHLDDVLQERYGLYGPLMLCALIDLPFLIAIYIWLFSFFGEGVLLDATGTFFWLALLLSLLSMVPSIGIYSLIDHLWERKIKRVKERKFRHRHPYWQPLG